MTQQDFEARILDTLKEIVEWEVYGNLEAGGYGMWVMFPSRAEDGRLHIAGTAMREDEVL